ncbi:unnamed protein product, partial [Iphiclides podalirius]
MTDKEAFAQVSDDNKERLYENLSPRDHSQNDRSNEVSSAHSSSSTLVSENVRANNLSDKNKNVNDYSKYAARPQVPPKPQNEIIQATPPRSPEINHLDSTRYPDVYYHSLEKLTDKISPLDEIEIYKASQAQANPASVGAEIKRVSTKFLISPKKEAEVRTIQPTRARSLSLDKDKLRANWKANEELSKKEMLVNKPYNYSAPSTPIAVTHKRPIMPTTVSPYEHVRKTMIETEEKRNSLSRASVRNAHSSPRQPFIERSNPSTPVPGRETPTVDSNSEKEKTRQKVEAFYWQKLKELKQREDECFLRQSLDNRMRSPATLCSSSNRSTPSSLAVGVKSSSLPRGRDLNYNVTQQIYALAPFSRGAPERRTDSFIRNRTGDAEAGVQYRRTHETNTRTTSPAGVQMPIFQRGSLTQEARNNAHRPKRVSFDEQYSNTVPIDGDSARRVALDLKLSNDSYKSLNARNVPYQNKIISEVAQSPFRGPPRPPVRTTSVGSVAKNYKVVNKNVLLVSGVHSVCSESESGSEAGEIQRILQRTPRNGKSYYNMIKKNLMFSLK